MPVPTDTFWNIKRLNKIFALSALLLFAVIVWAVLDDYSRDWRQIQMGGATWQSAISPDSQSNPSGLSHFGSAMRDSPLLDFMNPAHKIRQAVLPDVLTDVSFKKVPTVDRCTTCHVNADRPEFTSEKIIDYLQAELSSARKMRLPQDRDESAAMPEFWHQWAVALGPEVVAANLQRIQTLTATLGNGVGAVYDGQTLNHLEYDPAATDPVVIQRQNAVVIELVKAWLIYSPSVGPNEAAARSTTGKVSVVIAPGIDPAVVASARSAALQYCGAFETAIQAKLSPEAFSDLQSKYRFALIAAINPMRSAKGLAPLDPSPVLLAHSHLDLYVGPQSKHPFETVGCTSCHDGSGQETDFVLSAHTARHIWVDRDTGEPLLYEQLHTAYSIEGGVIEYVDPVTGRRGDVLTQEKYWAKKYETTGGKTLEQVHRDFPRPMLPAKYIQANCLRCHTSAYDIQQDAPVVCKGRNLYTTLGCINCHQTDTVPAYEIRKPGPDLRHISSKLSPAFTAAWIESPRSFRPSTVMPHFFNLENNSSPEDLLRTRQEALAMTQYLFRASTPLAPKFTIPPGISGDAARGRDLFMGIKSDDPYNTNRAGVGCIACHANLNETGRQWITSDLEQRASLSPEAAEVRYASMTYNQRQTYCLENFPEPDGAASPRRPIFEHHGPELSAIGTKLLSEKSRPQAQAWLFDWLKQPSHYSETTLMPSLRLSDQEALDLTAYLLEQTRDKQDQDLLSRNDPKINAATKSRLPDDWALTPAAPDPAILRQLTALFLRSKFPGSAAVEKSDDDNLLTDLATDAMNDTSMPAEELMKLRREIAPLPKTQKQLLFLGKRLVAYYGCAQCHAVPGGDQMISPGANLSDWGQKRPEMLDFGPLDPHQSRSAWLDQELKNPRIWDRGKSIADPYAKLKMPDFNLPQEQIDALTTFVLSNRDRLITERMISAATTPQAMQIAKGRAITRMYNCVACHEIENNDPAVHQYYQQRSASLTQSIISTMAPPSLHGEGNKINFQWLDNFLANVQPIRPLLTIRMPTFWWRDEDIHALLAYFSAASNHESRELKLAIDPILQYIAAEKSAGRSGNDWWTQPDLAGSVDALRQWSLIHDQAKPIQFVADNPAYLAQSYTQVLYDARFIQELYDSPYPFVETLHPNSDPQHFERGRQFVQAMGCLNCHVLGNPPDSATRDQFKAPNLDLISQRLQPRWVRFWVQNPEIVQPHAIMPAYFDGLAANHLEGCPWQIAQNLNPQNHAWAEQQFGKTVQQQKDLLLDFLYAAALRGYSMVQDPALIPSTQPTQ